jgi:hypothetical protein
VLVIAGFIFLCLGLLTGVALILAPVGLWSLHASLTTYILFTVLVGVGYLLLAVSSKLAALPAVARITGAMLLLLALGAAAALVLVSTAMIPAASGTLPLWYVFVVGGLVGVALLSAHRTVATR